MRFKTLVNMILCRETKMQKIMRKSWSLSRKGSMKFGGSPKDYLSESMKIVWAEDKRC